ncbi:hypothetical protein [Enterococcus sp. DIV0187]|uniref:hypothetical protein n=1 Tax=Enterococcus sp. DIV0187 TaxID=2774644 RepID=UPI003F27C1DE
MKSVVFKRGVLAGAAFLLVMGVAGCSTNDGTSSSTNSSSKVKETTESSVKKVTSQDIIDELELKKVDENADTKTKNEVLVENKEKIEAAGYLVINANMIFIQKYESAKASLVARNLKVKGVKSEPTSDSDSAGKIISTDYPDAIKFTSGYIGPAIKVMTEGDKVILNYYEGTTTSSSEKTEKTEKTSEKQTKNDDVISELGLEKTEDYSSAVYVKNREKLENAGYLVISNNDVFNSNYDSVKENLEELGLKVTGNEGKSAEGDKTAGNIYETNYPNAIKLSSKYLGSALRVLSEGDKVIVTYYK